MLSGIQKSRRGLRESDMFVKLEQDGRTAEIIGDDALIESSLAYAGVFERQVKEVTVRFYAILAAAKERP